MSNPKLRTYAQRSIVKALRDGLAPTALQIPGQRDDVNEATEEWVAYYPLEVPRWPSRKGVFAGTVVFQVSCFARFAEQRTDEQTDAPWVLADRVRTILDGAGILVRSYGDEPVSDVACLQLGDGAEVYLDERRLGVLPPAGGSVSNCHAVVLTYRGSMGAT